MKQRKTSLRLCISLAGLLAALLGGCSSPQNSQTGEFAPSAQEQIVLPLEIIGPDGYTTEVTFDLSADEAARADTLYLQVHRLGYRDSSANPDRGAKGSVRLNGGGSEGWTALTSQNLDVEVLGAAADYGGVGGGYHTVELTVPIGGAVGGENRLEFRFNGTDGVTSGYRVLAFDLLSGGEGSGLLAARNLFTWDDPDTWQAPLGGDAAKEGENLWRGLNESGRGRKQISAYPGGPEIEASCASCHDRDGRDLEYYNYSNHVIGMRSRFHGLSEAQGEKIASYIRSLDVPNPGRPWNPPYQPGPGAEENWAAGAGLDAVLDEDAAMLGSLFPEGTSREGIDRVVDTNSKLNLRTLPIALQFPDWNAWLPEVHPIDIWGATFEDGVTSSGGVSLHPNRVYEEAGADDLNVLTDLNTSVRQFLDEGGARYAQNNAGSAWRVLEGGTIDEASLPAEAAKVNLARWSSVKQWELVQHFELEGRAADFLAQPTIGVEQRHAEAYAWPSAGQSVWANAPHITADNLEYFNSGTADVQDYNSAQSSLVGIYASTAWYQLQLTLNPGMRQRVNVQPVDWPYQMLHITKLSQASGVPHGLRFTSTLIKMQQMRDNGDGPTLNGWTMRQVHPWWFYSSRCGDEAVLASLDDAESGLRRLVTQELLREWAEVTSSFPVSAWTYRPAEDNSTASWYALEEQTYVPRYEPYGPVYCPSSTGGHPQLFEMPSINHADALYRAIPLFRELGVDEGVLSRVSTWADAVWTNGGVDWGVPKAPLSFD